ncbi:MAG: integrase domain-containing protein [Gammaproteobacteria bacterium]|nr:integrase domain-containing protein [Gammaproteobacteria bacterium]
MRDLNFQLKTLCHRHKEGSYRTRHDRHAQLQLIANQVHDLGFRHLHASGLKHKHVEALVAHWQSTAISDGVIKNRMAVLRWWAQKANCPASVAKDNSVYGIGRRQLVTHFDKSVPLHQAQLDKIQDPYVRASLLLQQQFGLRREEAIKFQPVYADQGNHLRLKGSWTKGGKVRTIPIRTSEQRAVLDQIKQIAGGGALIPAHLNYVQQLRRYEYHTAHAGLSKLHGLRHGYAQRRYQDLTGWKAPAAGGPKSLQLSSSQKQKDLESRLMISAELGHIREQITAVYLGR